MMSSNKRRATNTKSRAKTAQAPRSASEPNQNNDEDDQYEVIESRPKTSKPPKTRSYEYPKMTLADFPQWSPRTPKLSPRTVWSTNRQDDPPNTIRTHRSRMQSAKISTQKPGDWEKFSDEMKMYLPRNFRFLLDDPEVFRRLLKDPDWLSKLDGHVSDLQMSYLRTVRSARVANDKKKEKVRMVSITQKKEIEMVYLPVVKVWENQSIPAQKLELGQPKVGEKQKNLILVGGAGTGKSMLVDSMVNYVLQVKWEDKFRLKITSERDRNGWVNAFTVPQTNDTKLPYTLNIVDFPAFGRESGTQNEDAKWMQKFEEFFEYHQEHHIDSIHTICFVQRADETSIPPVQKYVHQRFLDLFGEGIKENMCNMITFAEKDEEKPPVLQALEEGGLPNEKSFIFNNGALYHGKKKSDEDKREGENDDIKEEESDKKGKKDKKTKKGNQPNGKKTEEDEESLFKKFWVKRESNFDKVFNCIDKMKPKSLVLDDAQMTQREELEDSINHLRVLIQGNAQKLQQLETEQKLVQECEEEIKKEEDFSYEVYDVEKVKRDAPDSGGNVTNCSICYTTCHQNCAIEKDEDKLGCWAMTDGYCRICVRKCKWDKHYNRIFIFYLRISKKDKMFSHLCQEHEVAPHQLPSALQREHNETEATLKETISKSREGINSLNKIVSNSSPLSQNQFIDMVIHEELREGTPGWKERIDILKKMKSKGQVTIKMKGVNAAGKVIYKPM